MIICNGLLMTYLESKTYELEIAYMYEIFINNRI